MAGRGEEALRGGAERFPGSDLDLSAHDVNASIVRCVELQRHVGHVLAVELLGHGEDGRGLAGAGRAVEEEVGEAVLTHQLLNCAAIAERVDIEKIQLAMIRCVH